MADITDKVAQIRQAVYGKDVRESIASGIEAINSDAENAVSTANGAVNTIQTAVQDANTATTNANNAASAANTAASNANTAADAANRAAQAAIDADTIMWGGVLNKPIFDVRDYSSVDDDVRIQTAINAAKAAGKSIVLIPDGTYLINTAIKVPSNITIIMGKNTILKRNADINNIMINDADGIAGGYTANENITIIGGVFDANKAAYATVCTSLAFGHSNRIKVIGTKFINNYDWHMIELNAVQNAIVEKCYFKDYGTETTGSEMLQLDLMLGTEQFPWFGPYDNTACDNITIQDCLFENGKKAIGSHSAVDNIFHNNIKILRNTFKSCILSSYRAISALNYNNLIVKDNYFENCSGGVSTAASSGTTQYENINILHNIFLNISPSNVYARAIYVTGSLSSYVNNVNIIENRVDLVGKHGIGVDYGINVLIKGNIVARCGQAGIWGGFSGSNVVIIGNIVKGNNTTATEYRYDMMIGWNSPEVTSAIVKDNICDTFAVQHATNALITNNFIGTYTDMGSNANLQKIANFINNVWIA